MVYSLDRFDPTKRVGAGGDRNEAWDGNEEGNRNMWKGTIGFIPDQAFEIGGKQGAVNVQRIQTEGSYSFSGHQFKERNPIPNFATEMTPTNGITPGYVPENTPSYVPQNVSPAFTPGYVPENMPPAYTPAYVPANAYIPDEKPNGIPTTNLTIPDSTPTQGSNDIKYE